MSRRQLNGTLKPREPRWRELTFAATSLMKMLQAELQSRGPRPPSGVAAPVQDRPPLGLMSPCDVSPRQWKRERNARAFAGGGVQRELPANLTEALAHVLEAVAAGNPVILH